MTRRSSRSFPGGRRRRSAAAARPDRPAPPPRPRPAGRRPRLLPLALQARRELDLIQARELASLLVLAAGLALGRRGDQGLAGPFPRLLPSLGEWGRSARRILQRVTTPRPEARLILRLLERSVRSWPPPAELAAAARALHEGPETCLAEAHVLLATGHAEAGLARYRELALALEELPLRREVLLGLASAHLALGRYRLALGALDAAAEAPGARTLELVGGLALAWRVGDERRARRAAARLDLQVDPASPELDQGLAWLRRLVRGQRGWGRAARLARAYQDGRPSPTARVVRLVLEAEPEA